MTGASGEGGGEPLQVTWRASGPNTLRTRRSAASSPTPAVLSSYILDAAMAGCVPATNHAPSIRSPEECPLWVGSGPGRRRLARISHDSTAFVGERWTCV